MQHHSVMEKENEYSAPFVEIRMNVPDKLQVDNVYYFTSIAVRRHARRVDQENPKTSSGAFRE